MIPQDYDAYLKTEHWQKMRTLALDRALQRCQVCNSPDALDVHHRTYDRLGHELPEDLTVLCGRCHTLFHKQAKPAPEAVAADAAVQEYNAQLARQYAGKQPAIRGLPTGFLDLDLKTAGLQPGELVAVAGVAGAGKSTFLVNLVRQWVIGQGRAVFLATLQESRIEVIERLLCCEARIDQQRLRSGQLDGKSLRSLEQVGETLRAAKFFIDDTPARTVSDIAASAARLGKERGIEILLIDPLEGVQPENPREYRGEQLGKIVRRLKLVATELSVPVVFAVAISGAAVADRSDHLPRLSDLFRGAGIEETADKVILLHRPEFYQPDQHAGILEAIIGKNRKGPTGEVTLTLVKQFGRVENFAVESPFGFEDPR